MRSSLCLRAHPCDCSMSCSVLPSGAVSPVSCATGPPCGDPGWTTASFALTHHACCAASVRVMRRLWSVVSSLRRMSFASRERKGGAAYSPAMIFL